MRIIKLLPVGDVGEDEMKFIAHNLEEFGFQVDVLSPAPLPKAGYNSLRDQYLAETFLLMAQKIGSIALCITDVDLFTRGFNFIFGQASQGHKVAVVSLHRLWDKREDVYAARILKEVFHELGHIFGLKHCHNPKCVMYFSNTIMDTDRKSIDYCEKCIEKIKMRII